MTTLTAGGLMAKAERACSSARLLLDSGDVDGACNRAYYAMFDAARAALLASGSPESNSGRTHKGLIGAFGEHVVKNGPVPKEVGRLLKRAEEIRLVADYRENSVNLSDASEIVQHAETFLEAIRIQFAASWESQVPTGG